MRYFVTGATGFIGNKLVLELLGKNHFVNILVRKDPSNLTHPNLQIFYGDLMNTKVISTAMNGCDYVFHLAAYANIWSKDKSLPYKTNVIGTKNVLEAAIRHNIKKVVFTSSAAVLSHSENNEEVEESFPLPANYLTDYEETKKQAEDLCNDFCKRGLDLVLVSPTRVFGPGLLNKSNSVSIIIKNYINGIWRIIPGDGSQIGNYVYIDDVVDGHINALKLGKAGNKYILGGTNSSYNNFFKRLKKVSGKNYKLFYLPISIMRIFSEFELFMANMFGKKPMITPPWVKRYMQNRLVSSKKAIDFIQYKITPLDEGIAKTIHWLNNEIK